MKEKILENKKNGMSALLLTTLALIASVVITVIGGMQMEEGSEFGIALFIVGVIWLSTGWIPYLGLRILKPQEALVLTLFGKYIGTIKNINNGPRPTSSLFVNT